MIALALLFAAIPQDTWHSASLGVQRADVAAGVYNGRLYVYGGYDGTGVTPPTNVLFAPLGGDGSVGSFTSTAAVPGGGGGTRMAFASGKMIVAGFNTTDTQVATVNSDGTLAPPASGGQLLWDPYGIGVVSNGSRVWLVGGQHVVGSGSSFTFTWYANTAATALDATFPSGQALPSGRGYHGVATDGTHLWSVGGLVDGGNSGSQGVSTSDVLVSTIDGNGLPGAWTATTALPSARYGVGSFVSGGFLFAIGGHTDTGGDALSDVMQARIKSDGTLGAWIHAAALPARRYLHGAVTNLGYAYVVGGFTTDYQSDVLYTKLTTPGPATKLTVSGPSTASTQDCAGPYLIGLADASGAPTWADAAQAVDLAASGGAVATRSDCSDQNAAGTTIVGGSDSAPFYVKWGAAAGTMTVAASASGLTLASASVTVTAHTPVDTPVTTEDPHGVNGWGCSTAPAGWLAVLALALRRRSR